MKTTIEEASSDLFEFLFPKDETVAVTHSDTTILVRSTLKLDVPVIYNGWPVRYELY